jgi:hypothetical protein
MTDQRFPNHSWRKSIMLCALRIWQMFLICPHPSRDAWQDVRCRMARSRTLPFRRYGVLALGVLEGERV